MKVLNVRNVQQALPVAVRLLRDYGLPRDSRNGPVLQAPWPVATVYEKPCERVLFWPERDANPFFHLYEALWMLAGRNDVEGVARYAKRMREFSDDGKTLHGAYGYRWRQAFGHHGRVYDQLKVIIGLLKRNQTDRRAILQMWDTTVDLAQDGRDVPCNLTATFQIGPDNRLHLVVFCRSNDIIWGAYGANAVHFSVLLEYMALAIGVPVGTYTQVSVNWHGYLDTLEKTKLGEMCDPYETQRIETTNFTSEKIECLVREPEVHVVPMRGHLEVLDDFIHAVLEAADTGFPKWRAWSDPWMQMVWDMLRAHHYWKSGEKKEAMGLLIQHDVDWHRAGREWMERRMK